jgi:hypothetical protein
VTKRKAFPLRIGQDVFDAIQKWADDDLRSVNAQIEFVLRDALVRRGRMKKSDRDGTGGDEA